MARNSVRIALLTVPCMVGLSLLLLLLLLPLVRWVDASAAGTETLVGIVGRDFVLLGADSSVSQSIALTASNLDKIAHLVEPFPEAYGTHHNNDDDDESLKTTTSSAETKSCKDTTNETHSSPSSSTARPGRRWWHQQAILAAAAGDAADSDQLLGYLKALGSIEEYKEGRLGCDVQYVSLEDKNDRQPKNPGGGSSSRNQNTASATSSGLDARSMAHLARRCIWERLRSRTPYRVCLLVAGMLVHNNDHHTAPSFDGDDGSTGSEHNDGNSITGKPAFLSQKVQNQVRQASWEFSNSDTNDPSSRSASALTPPNSGRSSSSSSHKPSLYWLDEYGSIQSIDYGAHGHGSNFLLSILDQHYRPDLSRAEALQLMHKCFEELQSRYIINSPEAPCIKCVDVHGIRLM